MKLRMLVVLCAALALSVGVAAATAGGGHGKAGAHGKASGVHGNADVHGKADVHGNSTAAKACQKGGWQTMFRSDGSSFTNTGDCVSYAAHGGTLASARLVLTADTYDCSGPTCWGTLVGSGLAPNAEVDFYSATPTPGMFGNGFADASGNFGPDQLDLVCGTGSTGVYATSTDADGNPITSNVVDTPCG